jgi:hypothetical protein
MYVIIRIYKCIHIYILYIYLEIVNIDKNKLMLMQLHLWIALYCPSIYAETFMHMNTYAYVYISIYGCLYI